MPARPRACPAAASVVRALGLRRRRFGRVGRVTLGFRLRAVLAGLRAAPPSVCGPFFLRRGGGASGLGAAFGAGRFSASAAAISADRRDVARGRRRAACSRAACRPRRRRAMRRRRPAAASSPRPRAREAFSSCRWPREFASAPSRRFASGTPRRLAGPAPCDRPRELPRPARRICSGAFALPSAIARSMIRTPAARSFSHGGACVTSVTRSSKSARSTDIETRSASAVIRRRRFGFSAAQSRGTVSRQAFDERPSVSFLTNSARSSYRTWRAGDRRPVALLVLVEVARVDALPLALDHGEPAAHVGRHGHEPRRRRQLAARTALHAAARRGRDAGALAVEVGVEQRVERDDAVVVGRVLRREVDDDARLLARMRAHDPADPLLVHALRGRRRKVHDDGRARRVPALGEQHRVDQDVDLAALVGRERLGELHRRRAAATASALIPAARNASRGCTRARPRRRRRSRACCRSGRGRGSRPPGSGPGGRAPRRGRPPSKSPPTIGTA